MEVKKMFYTMGEVAEMFDVSTSLIRYWEGKFSVIKPVRNKKGNRLFTPKDIENFKLIYHLVKERGMTLEGAQKSIKAGVMPVNKEVELMDRLLNMKSLLLEVREVLKEGESEDQAEALKEAEAEASDVEIDEEDDDLEEEDDENNENPDAEQSSKPRRRRRSKGQSEEKELFAFYEQKLF